jgi:hypothetical protein
MWFDLDLILGVSAEISQCHKASEHRPRNADPGDEGPDPNLGPVLGVAAALSFRHECGHLGAA